MGNFHVFIQPLSQGFVAFWQRQSADSLKLQKRCRNLSPLSNRIKKHGGSRIFFFFFFFPMRLCAPGVFFLQRCRRCSYSLSSYLMVEDKWWLLCLQRPLCSCQWTVIIHWPVHHLAMKNALYQSHADIYCSAPRPLLSNLSLVKPQTIIRLTLASWPTPPALLMESIYCPSCMINNFSSLHARR